MVKAELDGAVFNNCGETYRFTGEWRIPPCGHPLPALIDNEQRYLPPEAIFENDSGVRVGIHPLNPNLLIAGDWKPTPEDPKPLPKPPERVKYKK